MANSFTPKRKPEELTLYRNLEALLLLCDALATLKSPVEAAAILRDLLSPQEMVMVANRLLIAGMLLSGKNYDEIHESLGASTNTIARVSTWLETSGDGYRLITKRVNVRTSVSESQTSVSSTRSRKYGQYLWPVDMVASLLKTMSQDNACKILDILAESELKPELFKAIALYTDKSRNTS